MIPIKSDNKGRKNFGRPQWIRPKNNRPKSEISRERERESNPKRGIMGCKLSTGGRVETTVNTFTSSDSNYDMLKLIEKN